MTTRAVSNSPTASGNALTMLCLVIAGEVIFSLPFHITRFFRPTALGGFGLDNTALGDIFAVYGVTAMLAYFPGGALADRYSTRILLTASLLATAAGGLFLSTLPNTRAMTWLYGYWGVTTILLFWSALIRATREWGGALTQGRAFGILEGGRGLLAAGLASVAVGFIPNATDLDPLLRRHALTQVIYFYSAVTAAAGIFCWYAIPAHTITSDLRAQRISLRILRTPTLWLQALVVVVAYCGYKSLDYYSLYAHDLLKLSEGDAARLVAATGYLRPLCALAAGWLADRTRASTVTGALFAIAGVSYYVLMSAQLTGVLCANLLITIAVVYALRGIYFALMQECAVPAQSTGTAVGFISVLGYTPDIFFAPLAGRLLDRAPGSLGYQHLFELMLALVALGASTVVTLRWLLARSNVAISVAVR